MLRLFSWRPTFQYGFREELIFKRSLNPELFRFFPGLVLLFELLTVLVSPARALTMDPAIFELHQRRHRGIADLSLRSKVSFDIGQRQEAHDLFWQLSEAFDLTVQERILFAKTAFNNAKVMMLTFWSFLKPSLCVSVGISGIVCLLMSLSSS